MKFERTEVWGFEHAIRGMRNPLESWDKSDTRWIDDWDSQKENFYDGSCLEIDYDLGCVKVIGEEDLKLMQRLIKAGSEHRKFMRQIFISVDITAPLYWWKEMDTYKIGTVANSTSTMHKITSKEITEDCFEHGEMIFPETLEQLERLRIDFNLTKIKDYWQELIVNLPESWLQTRTVTMNYENVLSMIHQRQNHKLTEWSVSFIEWAKTLPYADELLFLSSSEKANN